MAYIIGFYINSREDTVFIEAWYHLFLAILISFDVYVQNWYASFNQLIWHYMKDLSGNQISYNNINSLKATELCT